MTAKKDYWTSKRSDGKWDVKRSGASEPSSLHNTLENAWREARRLARGAGSEAFLKGEDGRIRTQNSYGNNPYSPNG